MSNHSIKLAAATVLLLAGLAGTQATQPATTQPSHPMSYRILWTWDSWICDPDKAGSYVTEYRKLIDFMAAHEYNGLIIWGFLDDRHGGEKAAKEVATYAKAKGIRLLPGVGAGGYEGFVISRPHKYNLVTFLQEHPELRAVPRRSDKPSDEFLCLYQDASLAWLRDGARWLAENFDIGGANIETNEADGIDNCPLAAAATEAEPNRLRYSASFSDLARAVPVIFQELRRKDPESWVLYATYQPPWWQRQEDAALLQPIPAEAIAQWNMELNVNAEAKPPVRHNVSLVHSGGWSYHLGAFPSRWGFTQYRCFWPDIQEIRQFSVNQRKMAVDGFAVGNVGSPEMPDNEIAYIAYIEFTREPGMTVERFSQRFIAPMYGPAAEPLVLKLMLAQPPVQRSVAGLWQGWARMMTLGWWDSLQVAKPEQIKALADQLALAKQAQAVASPEGQKRLATIIAVLDEYRIIAELSTRPELGDLKAGRSKLDRDQRKTLFEKLIPAARAAGLPDGIYGYSKLLNRL